MVPRHADVVEPHVTVLSSAKAVRGLLILVYEEAPRERVQDEDQPSMLHLEADRLQDHVVCRESWHVDEVVVAVVVLKHEGKSFLADLALELLPLNHGDVRPVSPCFFGFQPVFEAEVVNELDSTSASADSE